MPLQLDDPVPDQSGKQLEAIHAVQDEIDSFMHRIKERLFWLENLVQNQVDDQLRLRGGSPLGERLVSPRDSNSEASNLTGNRRERSGTVDDMRQLQEPQALTEHREKKWESTSGWYWPLGTISSLTQTTNFLGTGKELRLHNRWMQLSMQAEDLLALSNYRRNGSSTLRYSPHKHSGLSAEFEGGRQVIFHPLGKFRVVWDLCGLCLLLADSILLPLSLAWGWQQGTKNTGEIFLLTVFLLSLAFWSLDIVTNLNTAFYLRGHLVLSRWLIVRHYLQTWFIIDAAVVSLDYVTLVNFIQEAEESSFGIVRFIRAARAFRLVRLLKMARFDDLMQEIAASTGRQWIMLVVAIINSTVAILLVAHVMTCFWFGLGRSLLMDQKNNWLTFTEIDGSTPWIQYLHSFRYVMDAPSPPMIDVDSRDERFFDILITIFCFVVIGTGISKISGTMVELRSMNEAKTKQRCEIRQYLHSQDASLELVSRVMKFVDYKLDKMMPTTFDSTLISHTLQTELSVNQRSAYIEQVPIFSLTLSLYPDVFSSVCVVLKKVVCENQEEVFVAGALSTCMYITATGEYTLVEGYDLSIEPKYLKGVNRLEELALYVDALAHQSSLIATTFAEMFTLDGDNLVNCLQNSPSCAAMFFEYAKEFTSAVKRAGGRPDFHEQAVLAERACKKTQIYQDLYPEQDTRLDKIDLSHINAANVESPEAFPFRTNTASRSFFGDHELQVIDEVADEAKHEISSECHNIQWMIEEGWKQDLHINSLPSQLQNCLPELHPTDGPHAIFEQPVERDRAESSCMCTLALIHNRYDIFTMPQPPAAKLLEKQWQILQHIVKWLQPTNEKIHAVLVLLAIRSLGKSKAVSSQIALSERSPEHVVLALIDEYQNVVPSVKGLSDVGITYAKGALRLHSMFNLAQMLQGENVPANVCQLQESIKRDGVEALRFYILFLLGFMSGLNAGRGSKFLTAKRAESFIEGVRVLKYLLDAAPCGIYWGFLTARAHSLGVPCQTAEELVLIRLACLARVEDRSAYRQLEVKWPRGSSDLPLEN
ncbi:unnamed protein product [Durusdinium trenchii]|uniref:Ion transport domain-containing protein n=1 Tax=Durusdinium trenchii TaxID=1381693 RepID=A0ABP0R6W0_9DINO